MEDHIGKNAPLYLQIRENYYQKLREGTYQAGDKLPSEDDIAADFGVTRVTVNKALSELLDRGILYRRHGAGTFVSKLRREGSGPAVLGFYDAIRAKGLAVESQVLACRLAQPARDVAEAMQLAPEEEVFHLRRLRRVNGRPVVLQSTYIRGGFARALPGQDYTRQSLYEVLKEAGHEVVRARDTVDAVNASREVSTLLDVPQNHALLTARRLGYGKNDRIIELSHSIYRGDQYELEIDYAQPSI